VLFCQPLTVSPTLNNITKLSPTLNNITKLSPTLNNITKLSPTLNNITKLSPNQLHRQVKEAKSTNAHLKGATVR